jgi:biopolymer transport protein ExbD
MDLDQLPPPLPGDSPGEMGDVPPPEPPGSAPPVPVPPVPEPPVAKAPVAKAPGAQADVATASMSAATVAPDTFSLPEDDVDDDEPLLQRKPRDEEELDMTPMVDVTFLLLIFFMVTAAFSLQKSIEMPRQQTDAPSTTVVEQEEEDLEMVEVQIDEFGSFLVLATDWQEETPGKQNLITTLKRAKQEGVPARLVIKVHELCKLQYLVDAMDAGTIAGYAETQVTQVEEFD